MDDDIAFDEKEDVQASSSLPSNSVPPELMTMLASSLFSTSQSKESELEDEKDDDQLTEEQKASLEALNQKAQVMMMSFLNELVIEKKYGDLSKEELMELVFQKVTELDDMLIIEDESTEMSLEEEEEEEEEEEGKEDHHDVNTLNQQQEQYQELNLLQSIEGLALHKMIFNGDLEEIHSFLESKEDMGMETWETKDLFGHTPLLLAIRRNRPDIALLLVNKGANVNVKTLDDYHLLDEAVLTCWNPLIGAVYLTLQKKAWEDWLNRRESVITALKAIPDFYLELSWKFQSKGIFTPIVQSMAPKDTYKIWKKGGKLRMDSTIIGFGQGGGASPFRIRRGNISLVFDAERKLNKKEEEEDSDSDSDSDSDEEEDSEGTQDLLLLNREEFTVNPLLRQVAKPSEQQITRVVKDLKRSAKKTLNSFQLSSMNFEFKPTYHKKKKKRSFLRPKKKQQEEEEEEEKEKQKEESLTSKKEIKTNVIGKQEWLCELFEASADVNVSVLKREGRLQAFSKTDCEEEHFQQLYKVFPFLKLSFEDYFNFQDEYIELMKHEQDEQHEHFTDFLATKLPSFIKNGSKENTEQDQDEDKKETNECEINPFPLLFPYEPHQLTYKRFISNDKEQEQQQQQQQEQQQQNDKRKDQETSNSIVSERKVYGRKISSSLCLCPSFPITLDDLMPALEILAMNKGDLVMKKLQEILQAHSIPSSTHFPVKVEVPLMFMIKAVVEFIHFELDDTLDDDIFDIPEEFFEEFSLSDSEDNHETDNDKEEEGEENNAK